MFDDGESFFPQVVIVRDKAEFVKETFCVQYDIGNAGPYGIYSRIAIDIYLDGLPLIANIILLPAEAVPAYVLKTDVGKRSN